VEGPRDDGHAGSGLDPFRHLLGRILREGQKQDFLRLPDACLDEIGGLGGDDAGLARPRPGKDQRRILVDDNRKALFRRQRLALDGVKEILPAVQFGRDEGGDGIGPYRSRVAREFRTGRNARDDLGADGLGIQLRQERSIQSTGVVQQRCDLTRAGYRDGAASDSTSARILSSRAASFSRAARLKRVQATVTCSEKSWAAWWPHAFSVTSSCSPEWMVSAVPSIPFRREGALANDCNDMEATWPRRVIRM
jgi:hypothetical protein